MNVNEIEERVGDEIEKQILEWSETKKTEVCLSRYLARWVLERIGEVTLLNYTAHDLEVRDDIIKLLMGEQMNRIEFKLEQKERCRFCGKKLTKKDFYQTCRKCQPAYIMGRIEGREEIRRAIEAVLEEE